MTVNELIGELYVFQQQYGYIPVAIETPSGPVKIARCDISTSMDGVGIYLELVKENPNDQDNI